MWLNKFESWLDAWKQHSVAPTFCAHSATLMHSHVVICTRELCIAYGHRIYCQTILVRTTCNSYKANLGSVGKPVNLLLKKKSDNNLILSIDEVLHNRPTCYSMLHSMHT